MRKYECRIIPLDRTAEFQQVHEVIVQYFAINEKNADYKAEHVYMQPFPGCYVDYVKPI